MKRLCLLLALVISFSGFSQEYYLLIGTYTNTGSKGIYVYKFNTATGEAKWISNTDNAPNPSFLSIAPGGKFVYAVDEEGGQKKGQISAYAFDRKSGTLKFLNKQPSGGDHPCYVSVTRNNKWVLSGNYNGGSLAAFKVNKDGSLQPAAQVVQHQGSSVNKSRQEKAHVHSTNFSPNEDYVFVPDLGMDKVMIYKFNPNSDQPLQPAEPAFEAVTPGAGPRHFTFHPNNKFAYLIEEMGGAVAAFQYNKGKLNPIQTIDTHPEGFKGAIGSADIHLSPDGKFLYASNRGDENTITIFSVNPSTGKLGLVGYESTKGQTPRNFMIDPSGNYLLVANQNTNNIVIFKRDKQTGKLEATGKQIEVPAPVCLKMTK